MSLGILKNLLIPLEYTNIYELSKTAINGNTKLLFLGFPFVYVSNYYVEGIGEGVLRDLLYWALIGYYHCEVWGAPPNNQCVQTLR